MPIPERSPLALKVSRRGAARCCSRSAEVSAQVPEVIRAWAKAPVSARALPGAAVIGRWPSTRRRGLQSRQSKLLQAFGISFGVILSDLHPFFQTKPGRDLRRYFGCGLALPGSPVCWRYRPPNGQSRACVPKRVQRESSLVFTESLRPGWSGDGSRRESELCVLIRSSFLQINPMNQGC